MFEDQNPQINQPSKPRPPQPVNTPVNLPTKEGPLTAEDIFSATDNADAAKSSVSSRNETSRRPTQPAVPSPTSTQSQIDVGPLPAPSPLFTKGPSMARRKILVFLLSAFVVALLFIGGYLAYRILIVSKNLPQPESIKPTPTSEPSPPPPAPVNKEPIVTITSDKKDGQSPLTVNFTSAAVDADGIVASYKWDFGDGKISDQPNTSHTYSEEGNYLVRLEVVDDKGGKAEKSMTISVSAPPPPPPPAPEPPPLLPTDTDQDGLSDLEELQIGTNPRMIDTDLDGLDDYAEVKVYKSDPTKRDTDGDGYDDGLEVKSGYSPVGKGKL